MSVDGGVNKVVGGQYFNGQNRVATFSTYAVVFEAIKQSECRLDKDLLRNRDETVTTSMPELFG